MLDFAIGGETRTGCWYSCCYCLTGLMAADLPPYLTTAEVAKACEMKTRRVRGMLMRAGILERLGRLWVVGDSRLRARLPEIYGRVSLTTS
jgi:hypothetical protein